MSRGFVQSHSPLTRVNLLTLHFKKMYLQKIYLHMHTYTHKHACKHIHTHLHMPVHAHTNTYVYALAHTNTITMHLHMHAQSHMYRLVLDTHTYVSVLLLYLLRRYFSPDFCSSRYVCSTFCRASVWVLPGVGSRNTCCTKHLTFPLL